MGPVGTYLEQTLRGAFPDAALEVLDTTGTDDHFAVTIASARFAGMSRIAQHRLVHEALGDTVGREIHALSLTIHTVGGG